MKISRILTLLIALLALIAALPASAQGGLLAQTTTDVILRAGPGREWRQLAVLPPGTALNIDGYAFDGAWARGIIADGTVGWVLSDYLNVSRDQLLALQPIYDGTPFTLSPPPAGASSAPPPAAPQAAAPVEQPAQQAAAPAPSGGSTPGAILVTRERANLRQDAASGASVIRLLDSNEPLTLLGRDSSGSWIRVITSRGEIGWISWSLTSFDPGAITRVPIVTNSTPVLYGAPDANAAPAPATVAQPAAPAEQQAAAPPPPPINSRPVPGGFAYGGHIQGYSERTINAMRTAGMTWVKQQVRYRAGMDPNSIGGIIDAAHAYGFHILLGVVGLTNELNNGGYYDQYASFVAGLAARGADAIEVWNEPNIDREWPAGQISPAQYTQLLAVAYNAIKGANPNTLVISGAPAPTGYFGGCSGAGCDDNHFIAGMAAAGAARYMDCLGLHYNEGIVPPSARSGDPRGNSGYYTRYFWGMIDTYWNAFRGARPLCFTELGYLTPEGFPPLPGSFGWAENVTVAQQAAWLDQAVDLSRSSGKVRLLIIWNVDYTEYGADPMAGYAMIRPDGSCPACQALGR